VLKQPVSETPNSTLGLELSLSINSTTIETGQPINISLNLQNTFPRTNNVSAEWNWAFPSLRNFSYSILPCPRWDTFRIFNGYYSQSNVSSATPLYLWPTSEGYPPCPFWNFSNYLFQPSSNMMNVSNTFPSNYHVSFSTAESHSLSGYYLPGSNKFPPATPFPVGVYTIAAGDEWGQLMMLHFNVTQGSRTNQTTSSSTCQAIGRVNSTISTGGNTIGGPIAYDSHVNEIYATGTSFNYQGPGQSNSVYVINPSTNSSIATIAVGTEPTDIAYDPSNYNLYVTNFGSNSVSVISDSTNKLIGNISVGVGPIRITYNPYNQNLYVSNRNSGTVSVINGTTNTIVSNITVSSSPFEIAYDSFNHDLYVTDGAQSNVTIINSSNIVVGNFSIGQGSGMIAYDSVNNDLYFFPQDSQVLYIINGSNNKLVGNISGISDLNAITYNPANNDIYVAGNASGGFLTVISGSSNASTIIASIEGKNWVPVDFAYVDGSMYLGTNYGNAIYVLSSQGTSGVDVTCTNLNPVVTYIGTVVTTVMTTSNG
jgi:YVTN family beta-propeller protein